MGWCFTFTPFSFINMRDFFFREPSLYFQFKLNLFHSILLTWWVSQRSFHFTLNWKLRKLSERIFLCLNRLVYSKCKKLTRILVWNNYNNDEIHFNYNTYIRFTINIPRFFKPEKQWAFIFLPSFKTGRKSTQSISTTGRSNHCPKIPGGNTHGLQGHWKPRYTTNEKFAHLARPKSFCWILK